MVYIPKNILQTQIDITNICNLKCLHCRANANTIKENISYNQFIDIIKQLEENGVKRITISGGEPFLNKDIYKILDYLKQKKSNFDYIGITSNGYFYDSTFFENIVNYKDFIRIQISVDGFNDDHNLNRGISNAFEKTLNNIQKLIGLGINVSTSTTVNKYNLDKIESLIDYMISMGIKNISFRHEIPTGRSNIKVNFEFKKRYVKLLAKYFCRTANEFKNVNFFSGDPIRLMLDSEFLKGENLKDIVSGNIIGGCSVGIVSIYIGANGLINGCPYLNENIGSLGDNISTLWNNEEVFEKFRNRDLLKGNCGYCKWKHICGGCRAVAKNSGDILGGDEFCLFGSDDIEVFNKYIERQGLGKDILNISSEYFEGSVFVPLWCQSIVKLEGKNNINDVLESNWARRDIKEIIKLGYRYEISENEEDLIYFYKNMYLDYALSRYSEKELIIMPYFFLYNLFKNSGKIIFVVDKNGNKLGGYLLSKVEEGYYVATSMGICLGNIGDTTNFVSSALYYYLIEWGMSQNLRKLSFGKTRIYKNDGVLKFKKKWGVTVLEHEKKGVYINFLSGTNYNDIFYL